MQVLDWYNQINSFMLDYISTSVKESDLSSFYRLIIAFKNLQRSVEFSGKSGIFGIRYIVYKLFEEIVLIYILIISNTTHLNNNSDIILF